MIKTHDKAGLQLHISYTEDCAENAGGFYCETYLDENGDRKIDDFCVHPEDCDCSNHKAVENVIRHHYDDIEFKDLTRDFDNAPINPRELKYKNLKS